MMKHLFENLNAEALENAKSAIVVTDSRKQDNPIIFANRAFEVLTGYDLENILGRNCRFLQGEDTDQPGLNRLRGALNEGVPCTCVLKNYRKEGSVFYNELFITPVSDGDGTICFFYGCQNEINDPQRVEIFSSANRGLIRLTERERMVFQLIVNGLSNKSVAINLGISARTAEKHRLAVLNKFEVSELTLLTRYAIALGIPFSMEI